MDEPLMLDDELVTRVHACLADALRRTRLDPFQTPVTVAEIYQDLVPYRRIRSAVGFQMNADYEHTLLRLLSGEGGYARLEPSEASDELRAELDSPNPNVGLFRKFAACDVWITPLEIQQAEEQAAQSTAPATNGSSSPEAQDEAGAGIHDAPAATPPVVSSPAAPPATHVPDALPDVEPREGWTSTGTSWEEEVREWTESEPELLLEEEVEPADPEVELAQVRAEPTPAPGATHMLEMKHEGTAHTTGTSGACAFCDSKLPEGRLVRFCPYCGTDQSLRPCIACAEPLENGWRFCIACGSPQS